MRLSKFLSIVFSITLLSLLYVYQQTEIFRLGYLGQKKQTYFEDLLEKNSILRYNVEKSVSVVQIGNRILESADYEIPDKYRLVRLSPSEERLRFIRQSPQKETILSRIFGVKRKAEAKTVNSLTMLPSARTGRLGGN